MFCYLSCLVVKSFCGNEIKQMCLSPLQLCSICTHMSERPGTGHTRFIFQTFRIFRKTWVGFLFHHLGSSCCLSLPMDSSDGRGAGRAQKKKAPVRLMGPVTYGEGDRGSGWFMERYRLQVTKTPERYLVYFIPRYVLKIMGCFSWNSEVLRTGRMYVYIYVFHI